jgi:two-component system, NarL family, sensor histidine kinase UhpB
MRTPDESGGELRLLLVGDSPAEARGLRGMSGRSRGTRILLEECPTPAAVERLGRGAIDAVILDLSPTVSRGIQTFDQIQRLFPRIPIVVISADPDESAADLAFRHGAQDYLLKGQLDGPSLLRSMRYAVERKKWENALRKSEERFELMARATNDAVWDVDLTTQQLWWNVGARSHLGYPPDMVVSDLRWWRERLHPEDRERVLRRLDEVIQGGAQFWMDEYRFRCADGSYADIFDRGYILREGEERPIRMIGAMMDVTERRRAEEALREANEKLRTLIQASPDGYQKI